jgi:hypothetical protein
MAAKKVKLKATKKGTVWPLREQPVKHRGVPPHVPTDYTRRQVRMAIALGLSQAEVSLVTGIKKTTLCKYYMDDMELGKVDLLFRVGSNVAGVAVDPNHKDFIKAATLVLKARGKWAETTKTEVTGKDGKPIETVALPAIDARKLSVEQRSQLKAILMAAKGVPQEAPAEEGSDDDEA